MPIGEVVKYSITLGQILFAVHLALDKLIKSKIILIFVYFNDLVSGYVQTWTFSLSSRACFGD